MADHLVAQLERLGLTLDKTGTRHLSAPAQTAAGFGSRESQRKRLWNRGLEIKAGLE